MTVITKQHILITGANGFIGRNLCVFLKGKGNFVRGAVRNNARGVSGVDEYIQVGDINESTDWQEALDGVDAVIHLAARVHIMNDSAGNPATEGEMPEEVSEPIWARLEAFRKVNVLGTERLARMAAKAGVKRFIFISSVKVNGEGKTEPYREDDSPDPQDAYGISKREEGIRETVMTMSISYNV